MKPKIAVLGLGYVGLPVALAFSRKFPGAIGFDVNAKRVANLAKGQDVNADVSEDALRETSLVFTSDENDLCEANFFVVAVPTPIDEDKRPDLSPLEGASRIVGRAISKGSVIVFESTVYPGVTEELCGPIIAEESGLEQGKDFKLGYSPERINPGDLEHTLERIVKVVSAEDSESLKIISDVYSAIIDAGLHQASSIKVAEAAKVIENTQRDLNIALMNELALIFDRMDIPTKDVLDAAATKWNFLRFSPGLVGGHCIGVDPYYLTTKAEKLGYIPQVITAGRRINDSMGHFVAQRAVKLLSNSGVAIKGSRIGILGVTFKENISDVRNSRVPSMAQELMEFGAEVLLHDPFADAGEVRKEFGLELVAMDSLGDLDGLIYAVPHTAFVDLAETGLEGMLKKGGVLLDVKSLLDREKISGSTTYWAL